MPGKDTPLAACRFAPAANCPTLCRVLEMETISNETRAFSCVLQVVSSGVAA